MYFSLGEQDSHSVAYFKRSVFCTRCTIGATNLLNFTYSNMSNLKSVVSLEDFSLCCKGSLEGKTSKKQSGYHANAITINAKINMDCYILNYIR